MERHHLEVISIGPDKKTVSMILSGISIRLLSSERQALMAELSTVREMLRAGYLPLPGTLQKENEPPDPISLKKSRDTHQEATQVMDTLKHSGGLIQGETAGTFIRY